MRRAGGLLLFLLFLVAVLLQGSAGADAWRFPDKGGNGPLSIASVKASHGPQGGHFVTITFDHALNPSAMSPKDFVVVDLETSGGGKSEAWIYFLGVRGKLRTYYYVPSIKSGWPDGARFSRPNPKTIKLFVAPPMSGPGAYGAMFAVGSYSKTGCAKPCWDAVPNRGYLVHDWTRPAFEAFSAPEWTLADEAEVTWRSTDTGFSQILRTMLSAGSAGSGRWRSVATRSGSAKQTAKVPVQPGSHAMFQVMAEDGSRNRTRTRVLTTRVPFDQTTTESGAAFSGAWMETDVEGAYGGSVHTSTLPADSFTFSGRANSYCLLYDWETEVGSATFDVGGSTKPMSHEPNSSLPTMPDCFDFSEVADRTATLTVTAGRLRLDGFWSGRIGAWTKAGKPGYAGVLPRTTRVGRAPLTRLLDVARFRR